LKARPDRTRSVFERIPDDVRWLCEPLVDDEAGRNLLIRAPALAVAATVRAGAGPSWRERLDDLLARRPRDLAAHLGFGGSRRALRVLAKVEPESATVPVLRRLAGLLADPHEKWIFHLPALNAAVIRILAVPVRRALVTFGLLRDLCQDLDDVTGNMVVVTLDEVRTRRLSMTPSRALRRIASFEDLMAEDENLYYREVRQQLVLPFAPPEPPQFSVPAFLRGRFALVPLRDVEAVRAHGRQQGNCLARNRAQERDLIFGDQFLFKLTAIPPTGGERVDATLAVNMRGGPRIEDLRLAENHPAPTWLTDAVESVLQGGA
jgi:hypothetical protein